MGDLESVRSELTGEREAVVKTRMYAVVYGPPARYEAELSESVSLLDGYCEELVTAMRRMPGADASREEPAALRAIYHRALVGECDDRPTGREITFARAACAERINLGRLTASTHIVLDPEWPADWLRPL
jgi:hypothetical protein